MDERSLRQQLKKGDIRSAYILLGTDTTRAEKALQAILDVATDPSERAWAVTGFDGEEASASEVIEAVRTAPFLGGRRVVYVRRFDSMRAEEIEAISDLVAAAVPETVLILLAKALDQRRKAVKQLTQHAVVVQLEDPKGEGVLNWLLREAPQFGVRLQGRTARLLIDVAGSRVESLRRELEKVAAYVGEGNDVTEEDILAVAAAGTPEAAQNAIFQLCDAVAEGRTAQALLKLDELMTSGANAIYIVVMLARHFRHLLGVMTSGETEVSRVMKELNLKSNQRFVVERLLRQAARTDRERVEGALELLLEADMKLKRSAAPRPTLEVLTVRLTQAIAQPQAQWA